MDIGVLLVNRISSRSMRFTAAAANLSAICLLQFPHLFREISLDGAGGGMRC